MESTYSDDLSPEELLARVDADMTLLRSKLMAPKFYYVIIGTCMTVLVLSGYISGRVLIDEQSSMIKQWLIIGLTFVIDLILFAQINWYRQSKGVSAIRATVWSAKRKTFIIVTMLTIFGAGALNFLLGTHAMTWWYAVIISAAAGIISGTWGYLVDYVDLVGDGTWASLREDQRR